MRKTFAAFLLLALCACKPHPKPSSISFGDKHYADRPFNSGMSVPFVDSSLQAQFPWAAGTVDDYFQHSKNPSIRQFYKDTTLSPTFTHLQTIDGSRFLVVQLIHDYEDPERGEFADMIGHLFIDTDNHAVYEYQPASNSIALWERNK